MLSLPFKKEQFAKKCDINFYVQFSVFPLLKRANCSFIKSDPLILLFEQFEEIASTDDTKFPASKSLQDRGANRYIL